MCRKQLTDRFNTTVLHDTIMQILDKFMSTGSPHHWVNYLMPEDARWVELATAFSSESTVLPDVTKFEQLMLETRSVISRYVCGFLGATIDAINRINCEDNCMILISYSEFTNH